MSKEPDRKNPRWDMVNELYDYIDDGIVKISEKNKMNFIEISMALQMINQKVDYEQFKAMFDFNIESLAKQSDEDQPEGMYN